MELDALNNLNTFPLKGLDEFIKSCTMHNVREINITGTNTDPLMYEHHEKLVAYLREHLSDCVIGIRTNGVLATTKPEVWKLYDKGSVSVTSLNPIVYRNTMGNGNPPDIRAILNIKPDMPIKVNVVLCPETINGFDIYDTLDKLDALGIKTVNLREPYGQPRIGSPLIFPMGYRLGMPYYTWGNMDVTYWDVHYVEVESVNLYASGKISEDYPITRGHSDNGVVVPQYRWSAGRHQKQWIGV